MTTSVRQTTRFFEWFEHLRDLHAKDRIVARIRRLSLGNPGDAKPLGDGVSKLRLDFGPGYRIYFARHGQELLILLCGGDKSTQSRDIAQAKALARAWKE